MSPCGGHLAVGICRELISRSSTSINDLIIVSSLHASRACFLSYLVIGLTQSQNPELVLRIYIYKQKRDWVNLGVKGYGRRVIGYDLSSTGAPPAEGPRPACL